MALQNLPSCLPDHKSGVPFGFSSVWRPSLVCLTLLLGCAIPARSQYKLRPPAPDESITLMPGDAAVFESADERKDLPCTVTPRKPDVGFDLRFHTGFDITVPLNELSGTGQTVTVLFRVYSQSDPKHPAYFLQRFQTPFIDEDAKGNAFLQGGFDVGEGSYHVDWLMRDGAERVCSSHWDFDAAIAPKDKPMALFVRPGQVLEAALEPFVNDASRPLRQSGDSLSVRLLVNFAPQFSLSAALQRSDTDALVSILKVIQRDPHIGRISLVAFNMEDSRIVYRQDSADQIDFPALGRALRTVNLGTITVQRLGEKHSQTDFLESLIQHEMGTSTHPDAIIFAGPKAMLDVDVPQDDLRRIGDVECPVFYMNYNRNPQAVPWKDSISHAIRVFKGTEYTISRPRDLLVSTTEMVNRIVRFKHEKLAASTPSGSGASDGGAQ